MSVFDLLFVCAICQREVRDWQGRKGRDRQLEPLCRYCEGHDTRPMVRHGSFMDRRRATQLIALAEALNGEAHRIEWRRTYAAA